MGATLRCGVQASHCGGFSCCRAQALGTRASVVVAHGLSCSAVCGIFPDQGSNRAPCIGRQILNHCATREVPTLGLSILAFSPFTFKVIIHRYILIAILLIVFWLFCSSSLFLSSCLVLFPCDLLNFLSVMFLFLPIYFLCIYYRFWFVVTMRFMYNNLHI